MLGAGITAIRSAKNIPQYFKALRNWNKSSLKSGIFKTAPNISPKKTYDSNNNTFNIMERALKITDEDTWTGKNKGYIKLEDDYRAGKLTTPTTGQTDKGKTRGSFLAFQKQAEKKLLNKFGDISPSFINEGINNYKKFKIGKGSFASAQGGAPFHETKEGKKLVTFLKNRFDKPSTGKKLASDLLTEQKIFSHKPGQSEATLRTNFYNYTDKVLHMLPKHVQENYRAHMDARQFGAHMTAKKQVEFLGIHKLLKGKIKPIPDDPEVPIGVKRKIAEDNLQKFSDAYDKFPELMKNVKKGRTWTIDPERSRLEGIQRKKSFDLRKFRDQFGEENLLSLKEINQKFGRKIRRDLDQLIGKQYVFESPIHEKMFELQKGKILPYKKMKTAAARGHEMETEWWKDLPEEMKVDFRYPKFPTHTAINTFHKKLNKFYNLSDAKRKNAIKANDYNEVKRIDKNLRAIEGYLNELLLESRLPSGKVISPYEVGESFQYKMRNLIENQKELLKKLPNLKKELDKLRLRYGGLINSDLTDTIPPTRGPMSEGIPLLDPQESINRQHFQIGGFARLFGTLSKVPKAVGRFGDMIKPVGKAEKATDIAVAQAVEDKPAMFLSTINAIEDMPEVTMPANQWLGTIKNKPGVSATELDEFGLEALLTNIAKADPKRKLSKTELIETYNREMPKIDMDIAIAEPVSRGADDITKMLTRVREGRGTQQLENLDVTSNDPRLLTALHQPPQDATGMKIRESIINIMRGTNKTVGEDNVVSLLKSSYGGSSVELHKGQYFKELWESSFPKIFHSTNEIVKRDHLNALKNLVSSDDVVNLAKSRNIPEEEAFGQLYQALNIFDRQIMTADVPIPFWTKKMLYRLGDMGEGRGFFYKSKKNPAHEGAQFIPGGSGYGEIKFYQNFETGAIRAQEGTYKSGHFSGEVFKGNTGNSPFGWGRFSERIDESGRKILLMEEIQSDLHQGVAQKGYKYAPRLDKHDVLAEVGEFAKQLDIKKQTLESTRLRKEAIKQLPRAERESPANVTELKNIEKAIKKQIADVKKLQKKVEEQEKLTGRTGQVYPDTAFKKSENYAKLFMQGLMKMAHDKGYDGIALSTGKMKKAHGKIPKGGDKFYDEIGVKAMQRMAKKSGFRFSNTTIVDGNGYTWEKIPLIEMRDINTGVKIPGDATIPVYKKGGIVNKNVVRGYNGY